jgi:hemerythrin-like domain-containing protein
VGHENERRTFLRDGVIAGAAIALLGGRARGDAAPDAGPAASRVKLADVNATVDLMREHGVLRRVLLVYGEGVRRIRAGTPPPAEVLRSAGGIIERFIEDYHEKLEEEEVFPRMVAMGKLKDLVAVLLAQHQAGRKLTATILEQSTAEAMDSRARSKALSAALTQFIRMYEPHAAREDTVLFPAFQALFTEKEFDALGDRFEEKEHAVLGDAGFEGAVAQVAQLEKALDIYDLAQFTAGSTPSP